MVTGKQDSAATCSPLPSRAPGDQPAFASPASETPSYPAPCSFAAWSLSLSAESDCAKINLSEFWDSEPLLSEEGDANYQSLMVKLRAFRSKAAGPEGLGHMLAWMEAVEAMLFSLFCGASALNSVMVKSPQAERVDLDRLQRQLRGLRHEHSARTRMANTHSTLLDQLSGTVRQLQQQLNSFAAATVAVLEVEAGGSTGAAWTGPRAPSPAAAAMGLLLAATPGTPSAAAAAAAAPITAPAAGAAAQSHPHPPQAPVRAPTVAANKILLRGVSCAQADALAHGDFTALGLGEGPLGMYERRWRASNTGRVWNVEVVVTKDQRAAFIRAAALIKHTAGITVAPYLTPEGRAARRAKQAQFDSLVERGLQPYWRGTDIVTEEGDRRRVHTMQ